MTGLANGPPVAQEAENLGPSARASILWGGGFTLLRDVAQFGVMLILVRLLSPSDYGLAALVQSIVGVVSVISFATFSGHALQIRNPDEIDWQAHFTAAAVLNACIFCLVLALAWGMTFTDRYREAALPLAALSVVFLIDIPGTLRHRMLEATHDWKRFRLLLTVGTLLGLGSGLIVALMGGGVWALIVQIPMLGLPAAVDLFVTARFRPQWAWSWARYRETAMFSFNRIGAGGLARGRQLAEQMVLATAFDLATLGIFTRSMGLAALLAGRIGLVVMISLYPVITRAEQGSARFQRLSSLVLRGVCWTTAPAAAFLGIAAVDTVRLLYGSQWDAVSPLLPLAAAVVGLGGVTAVLTSLLLASNEALASLRIDLISGVTGIVLAIVVVPYGAAGYLAALVVQGLLIVGIAIKLLLGRGGIDRDGMAAAFVPAVAASLVAVIVVEGADRALGTSPYILVRLAADALIFGGAYVATLRVAFAGPLADLLEVVPAGEFLARQLRLAPSRP